LTNRLLNNAVEEREQVLNTIFRP